MLLEQVYFGLILLNPIKTHIKNDRFTKYYLSFFKKDVLRGSYFSIQYLDDPVSHSAPQALD